MIREGIPALFQVLIRRWWTEPRGLGHPSAGRLAVASIGPWSERKRAGVGWRWAPRRPRRRRLRFRRRARRFASAGAPRSPARCSVPHLAGERIVAGLAGTEFSPGLEAGDRRRPDCRRRPLRRQPPEPRRGQAPDRPAAGDPPAAGPARSAAGDGRPGGRAGEAGRRRPHRLGRGDGRARRRLQPRAGPAHGGEPARARRQRRPGAGPRRRPARRDDRRDRTRLRRDRGQQVAATAVPFAAGLQEGGVAATAKHFPGLGAAAGEHRLRRAADRPLKAGAASESTRLPTAPSSPPVATW